MSMPDEYDEEIEDEQQEPEQQSGARSLRNKLKQAERERDELRARAERAEVLEKENALFKANLGNLTEAQQDAVLKTSKEFTAEAVRSQAELLGFVQPPEPAAPPEDVQVFDRVADAAAGGEGRLNPANYDAEVAAAQTPEELRQVMAKYGRTPEVIE